MKSLMKIAGYTVRDIVRQKSFIASAIVCVLLMIVLRGCYQGSYSVNGQAVNSLNVAWQASLIAFSVVGHIAVLIGALLAMRIYRRDREDGSMVMLLARPVSRWSYSLGRLAGVFFVAWAFMLLLHGTIYVLALSNTGARLPGLFLAASGACFINVLFVVSLVCLCSFFVSDVVAVLLTIGVVATGMVSDLVFAAMHSKTLQSFMTNAPPDPALWRSIWPKTTALMLDATSWVSGVPTHYAGSIHPFVNVFVWTLIVGALVAMRFNREEL